MIYFAPFVCGPSRMLPPHQRMPAGRKIHFVIYEDDIRWQDLENPRWLDVSTENSREDLFPMAGAHSAGCEHSRQSPSFGYSACGGRQSSTRGLSLGICSKIAPIFGARSME
jgi:hypothetical protein